MDTTAYIQECSGDIGVTASYRRAIVSMLDALYYTVLYCMVYLQQTET